MEGKWSRPMRVCLSTRMMSRNEKRGIGDEVSRYGMILDLGIFPALACHEPPCPFGTRLLEAGKQGTAMMRSERSHHPQRAPSNGRLMSDELASHRALRAADVSQASSGSVADNDFRQLPALRSSTIRVLFGDRIVNGFVEKMESMNGGIVTRPSLAGRVLHCAPAVRTRHRER